MTGYRIWIWVGLLGLLGASVSSCNLFKKTPSPDEDRPVRLDPVTSNNSKDTSRTGTYTPITKVDVPPSVTKIDTSYLCDTLQQTPSRRIVVCYQKIGNRFIKVDTVAVLDLNAPTIVQPTDLDTTIRTKIAYRVVVLLPFMSNRFVPSSGREIPVQSIKAIEFYEGVLMALDSLQAEGVSLFVDVFDTQRDTLVVQRLLATQALQEADLILGPVTSSNLSIVAEFGKRYKKTVVSPLNSRTDLTSNNPYFIQVNPAFDVHARHMIDLLDRIERPIRYRPQEEPRNYLILAMARDSNRVEAIQAQYGLYKNQFGATLPTVIRPSATIDIADLKPQLKSNQLNVILMPTYQDESFVYNSLRELQKLLDKVEPRKGYEIAVIGMDRWRYFNRVNFEYYEDLNLHFTSEYYAPNTALVRDFQTDYKALYGIGSRGFSLKGFDIMLYFGRMLKRYGVTFQAHLWKTPARYRHTEFRLQPRYKANQPPMAGKRNVPNEQVPILDHYENTFLNQLKFEDFDLRRINRAE